MLVNILLNKVNYWLFFFRPEFIEFFGLHATSSNGSPILTASASPLNDDDDDNAPKVNDDDTENPSTPVVKYIKRFSFLFLIIFYFDLVRYKSC
jgi:hypothetical protein